jgi:hypothetical protein
MSKIALTPMAAIVTAMALTSFTSPTRAECIIILPGVTYSGLADVGAGSYPVIGPGSFSITSEGTGDFAGLQQAVAQGNIQITSTPLVAVSAGASASSDAVHSGTAGVSASFGITYYFEVVGPADNISLAINSRGIASVQAGGQGSFDSEDTAQAQISITSTATDATRLTSGVASVVKPGASFATSPPNPDSFFIDGSFLAAANQVYQVDMNVSVNGLVQGFGPGNFVSVSASVDPQITIDPDAPNASQYALVFSPGVGDGPIAAIPELSTWALMFIGFTSLGIASCWRGRQFA